MCLSASTKYLSRILSSWIYLALANASIFKIIFFSYFVFFICLPAFFYSNSFPAQRVISLRGTYLRRWQKDNYILGNPKGTEKRKSLPKQTCNECQKHGAFTFVPYLYSLLLPKCPPSPS